MTTQNQMAVYAFLMNTAYNMWVDESKEPFIKKLGKAALNSIPLTLAFDTKELVQYAAKKMNITDKISQPTNSFHSMTNVVHGTAKTLEDLVEKKNMPAYYSKPGEEYKNFE